MQQSAHGPDTGFPGHIIWQREVRMNFWQKLGIAVGALLVLTMLGYGFFRAGFVGKVENYEIGYVFHPLSGEIERLDRPGYHLMLPWDNLGVIDKRPMQVCIAANKRVLNCKLVQFNPSEEGLKTFLSWHGVDYASGTVASAGSGSPLAEILMSYAYDGSGKTYPFLTVIREMKGIDADAASVQ